MSIIQPRPYQVEATEKSLQRWQEGVTRQLIVLPTGCHAKGTPILMYDGTIRNVEDIAEGEQLMGPDSKPRTVLELVRGVGNMYRITPAKGDSFIVNDDHILSLKRTSPEYKGDDIVNISVLDYLEESPEFKSAYKLYRVPVEFTKTPTADDPYEAGVQLALNGGWVADCYKINSRSIRLEFLAGLLDTQGSGEEDRLEFSSLSRQLVEDVVFLARSLGFGAYLATKLIFNNQSEYYVLLYGDFSVIPFRQQSMQEAVQEVSKADDALVTAFEVTAIWGAHYFGFQVDSDNLYLIGDFTVTHNCGKTIIFGMVTEALRKRTLVLAHREELLFQAVQKMHLMCPQATIGILQGKESRGLQADICVASVQTAVRRIPDLLRCGFEFCICDEAHHAVARTYLTIFRELGFLYDDPNKLLLGVTATAYRADKYGLQDVFQAIVFERTIFAMVRAGYLCDLRGLEIKTTTNISSVAVSGDDFVAKDLALCVDTLERNALIADSYLKYGEHRHGVVFGTTVDHAINLAQMFKSRGIACEAVYGEMDSQQRRRILQMYADHELDVISNVGILTEGWDSPDTDCIMMARPTKSRGLYVQCVGRSLRPFPGKQDSLLLDFVDVASRHDICNFGTLAGKSRLRRTENGLLFDWEEDEDGHNSSEDELIVTEVEDDGSNIDTDRPILRDIKAPDYETSELNLFSRSKYKWQLDTRGLPSVKRCYYLAFLDGSCLWCFNSPQDGGYLATYITETGEASLLSELALPLEYAMGVCEDSIRRRNITVAAQSEKDAVWRDLPATDKQIDALRRVGAHTSKPYATLTRGEASDILDNKFGGVLATIKQILFLRTNDIYPIPELLTKQVANKLINSYLGKQSREHEREVAYQQYSDSSQQQRYGNGEVQFDRKGRLVV